MGMFDTLELGVPSLSLKGVRKGLKLQGIILPIQQLNKETGTVDLVSFREDPDLDQAGNPKHYPSGDPILVGQMLLQTKLRGWDLTSAEFEKRTEEFPEETDAGLRRWFVGSKYASKAVKAAYRTLRVPPEIGGLFTLEVVSIESDKAKNGEAYTYPSLALDWKPADEAGRKVVKRYVESDAFRPLETATSKASAFQGGTSAPDTGSSGFDPDEPAPPASSQGEGPASSADDDEPPF